MHSLVYGMQIKYYKCDALKWAEQRELFAWICLGSLAWLTNSGTDWQQTHCDWIEGIHGGTFDAVKMISESVAKADVKQCKWCERALSVAD